MSYEKVGIDEYQRLLKVNAALLEALGDLLKSADASWEEHGLGHDWRDACETARAAIKQAKGA